MIIRSALPSDKPYLASLLYYEQTVHRHLDWRPLLDWIGQSPFGVIEENKTIQAALACPSDPPEIAWIRLFAVGSKIPPKTAWQELWHFVLEQFSIKHSLITVGAIVLSSWFQNLLVDSSFEQKNEVVVLIWKVSPFRENSKNLPYRIRMMTQKDLPAVVKVDHQSFSSPWQISETGLFAGYEQAAVAMVAELNNEIIGYQISTAMNDSAHLARLAVIPEYQNCGVGTALVNALQRYCFRKGLRVLTVNTQADNFASLHLYKKLDFHPTGEKYPLFLFERQL
ncbi:MAG: GNAT family N-acetyltransferase [Anaerolineales bacterium]|nr:GNAT family N-acetyltransferase [Anaerolineales bacterium]